MTERAGLAGIWLGRRPYLPVLALQERLHQARVEGAIPDTVLLLEHEPVITLGKSADPSHVLFGEEALAERGISLVRTNRGGDVTLHAPGQLVGYPIVALEEGRRDVRRYVKDLAAVMAGLAGAHGISGGEVEGKVGFWVDRSDPSTFRGERHASDLAKLGAIGVRISRWVTMHGFALNLTTAPALFQLIVPCGIRGFGVTSVEELTARSPEVRAEAEAAHRLLSDQLGLSLGSWSDWSGRALPSGDAEAADAVGQDPPEIGIPV